MDAVSDALGAAVGGGDGAQAARKIAAARANTAGTQESNTGNARRAQEGMGSRAGRAASLVPPGAHFSICHLMDSPSNTRAVSAASEASSLPPPSASLFMLDAAPPRRTLRARGSRAL